MLDNKKNTTTRAPVTPITDFPSRAFREPSCVVFDSIREFVDIRRKGCRGGGIDAGDVMIRPELRKGKNRFFFVGEAVETFGINDK
jgi:hypothetical protein